MTRENPVTRLKRCTVHFVDGSAKAFSQLDVYASGLLVDPKSGTVIGPAGYLWVD